ncbi:hypothetical protein C0J52_04407 [Blattella germanica]|nr:hypothetical protein C0J52_04407 [Blattella germanica]
MDIRSQKKGIQPRAMICKSKNGNQITGEQLVLKAISPLLGHSIVPQQANDDRDQHSLSAATKWKTCCPNEALEETYSLFSNICLTTGTKSELTCHLIPSILASRNPPLAQISGTAIGKSFCLVTTMRLYQLAFVIIVMPQSKYTLEQSMILFETYTRKRSYLKCRIQFIRKFPGVSVPNKSTIHRLVCKVHETGAFADKKQNRKRTVLTEEKLGDIAACFEQSPHKIWNATKLLKFKLYKIGRVHKLLKQITNKDYNPHTLDELKENIHQQIALISVDELQRFSIMPERGSQLPFNHRRAYELSRNRNLFAEANYELTLSRHARASYDLSLS